MTEQPESSDDTEPAVENADRPWTGRAIGPRCKHQGSQQQPPRRVDDELAHGYATLAMSGRPREMKVVSLGTAGSNTTGTWFTVWQRLTAFIQPSAASSVRRSNICGDIVEYSMPNSIALMLARGIS